jgi:DcmR-like sensory protein
LGQPWETHLRTPAPCDHVIQLYTDDGFLTRAVGEFIGTALQQGEGAVVVATPAHVEAITAALRRCVDVVSARERTQLVVLDARSCLSHFMRAGHPDPDLFFTIVGAVLDRVSAAGFPRIRIFGEMVDLLWDQNLPATLELEALWSQVLAARGGSLLCAYRIDNFDRRAHGGVLHQLSRSHSHLVPVEDYARLERAVDRAYHEVFGADSEAGLLREILGQPPAGGPAMPPAQAALLALRNVRSDLADDVLERARRYYVAV